MNNRVGHLEEGDLLRLIDGELSEEAVAAAREHIESCWNCRAQFQEIETAIGEYVRYQRSTDLLLPRPPNAWPELRFQPGPVASKPPALFLIPSRRWFDLRWAAAAVAVIAVMAALQWFVRPPAVNAATLLRRASSVEPASRSMIRIKAGDRTIVRNAAIQHASLGSDDAQLRQLFERARFSWEEPFSARSFAAWRDQLADKEDSVRMEESAALGRQYVIRTTTHSSELHRATIALRERDMRPVREMLEFTGETVELEEAPDALPAVRGPEQITAAPGRESQPKTSPESTLHRMLQVFSVLHSLDADLGEPIEIRQTAGRIEVVATGLRPARQQQLQTALNDIPGVTVRFDSGAPQPVRGNSAVETPGTITARGQSRLEARLGSAQAAEEFTNRALDASDAVLARVHALRALARAFPPAQETALDPGDRQLLAQLRTDHGTALSRRIGELRSVLQPVVGDSTRSSAPADVSATWQEAVQKVFAAAQNMDETLNREIAGDGADSGGFAAIANAMSQLERAAAGIDASSKIAQ